MFSSSIRRLEIAGLPALVEPGLQARSVEAQRHVVPLAGHGLDPVRFMDQLAALGPNQIVTEPSGPAFDVGQRVVDAGKLLVRLQQRARLVVVNREGPGSSWRGLDLANATLYVLPPSR